MGGMTNPAPLPTGSKQIVSIVNSAFARVGAVPATDWLVESELDAKAFLHIASIAASELRKKKKNRQSTCFGKTRYYALPNSSGCPNAVWRDLHAE